LTATGDISGGSVDTVAAATLSAASDIVGISITSGGTVTLTADSNATPDADTDGYIQGVNILGGSTVVLVASENIDATTVTAQGGVTASAGADIGTSDFISVTAAIILAAHGDVTATDSLAATGIDYTVNGDVTGGSTTARGNILLKVDGGITNLEATTNGGDTITVAGATGAAAGSVDGGVFTADTISFTVANGVGADNAVILAGAESIVIRNTVGGGIIPSTPTTTPRRSQRRVQALVT